MTLNAKALEAARKRLQENLDSFDKEIAYQISTEGERADLWTEIDVNADDLRTVLSSLPHVGVSEEALESVKHAIIISMQGYDYGREELDEDIGPVFRTTSQQIALIEERAEIAAKRVIAALSRQQEEAAPVAWTSLAGMKAIAEGREAFMFPASGDTAHLIPLYASPVPADAGKPAAILTLAAMWRSGAFENDADAAAQDKADETPSGEAVDASLIIEAWLDNLPRQPRIRSALVPATSKAKGETGH